MEQPGSYLHPYKSLKLHQATVNRSDILKLFNPGDQGCQMHAKSMNKLMQNNTGPAVTIPLQQRLSNNNLDLPLAITEYFLTQSLMLKWLNHLQWRTLFMPLFKKKRKCKAAF